MCTHSSEMLCTYQRYFARVTDVVMSAARNSTRSFQQHATAGIGGVHTPELYGAVETLTRQLQRQYQRLAVITWYSSQKNMVKSFLHHLDLPIETLTVRSSRGYESQAIVLLLLPSNLADIFKTNWTVRVSGQ